MQGYNSLTRQAHVFLRENPEIQTVTLTRPKKKPRRAYRNGPSESFGRMPESCPIMRSIIDKMLPDGVEVTEVLRDNLFDRLYRDITDRFRDELNDVCSHKHKAIKSMRTMIKQMSSMIEEIETEVPTPPEPAPVQDPSEATVSFEDDEDEAVEEEEDE